MSLDTADYIIDPNESKSFFWNARNNQIIIGMNQSTYKNLIRANKLNEFISECLTHEHIHKWIDNTMGDTISSLFDTIGHHFEDYEMFNKMLCKKPNETTWKDFVKEKGFNAFAKYYDLSHFDLVEAGVRKY